MSALNSVLFELHHVFILLSDKRKKNMVTLRSLFLFSFEKIVVFFSIDERHAENVSSKRGYGY